MLNYNKRTLKENNEPAPKMHLREHCFAIGLNSNYPKLFQISYWNRL